LIGHRARESSTPLLALRSMPMPFLGDREALAKAVI
jgi:hypothetical protein